MRTITFDPGRLKGLDATRWAKWIARSDAALELLRSAAERGKPPKVDDAATVWRDAKKLLLRLAYRDKCGYCEYRLRGGSFGPADHFRPKGRVRTIDSDGQRTRVTSSSGEVHPGYWWLAVDWRNLVPACDYCNNHKSDLFPVEGRWCVTPEEAPTYDDLLAVEQPLMLHPLLDGPEAHLVFDSVGGIAPRDESPRGAATILICGLDRESLGDERRERQEEASLMFWLAACHPTDPFGLCQLVYDSYTAPVARYSAAVRDHLDRTIRSGEIVHLPGSGS